MTLRHVHYEHLTAYVPRGLRRMSGVMGSLIHFPGDLIACSPFTPLFNLFLAGLWLAPTRPVGSETGSHMLCSLRGRLVFPACG